MKLTKIFTAPTKAIFKALQALFGKGPWADEYQLAISFAPFALNAIGAVATALGNKNLADARVWLEGTLLRPVSFTEIVNDHSKKALMRDAARVILSGQLVGQYPAAKDHVLNLAIEFAFAKFYHSKDSN